MLNKLAGEIHEIAKSKGFWDNERNTGELLMLCVSELSEALEADRENKHADLDKFINGIRHDYISISSQDNFDVYFEEYIKDTFEGEIADTIIRLLDICSAKNIDIETHIKFKMEYNNRRDRLHGKAY